MMNESERARVYAEESARSFCNQDGTALIPSALLDDVVEIPLGFQPLGVSSHSLGNEGDALYVADYFSPAVLACRVTRIPEGLRFACEGELNWIRGSRGPGDERHRIFPDILGTSGANRLQTANRHPDYGDLWVSRNAEAKFLRLRWDGTASVWRQHDVVTFEKSIEPAMVHSARLWNRLETMTVIEQGPVEAGRNLKLVTYVLRGNLLTDRKSAGEVVLPPGVYGIGLRPGSHEHWLVTAPQCTEWKQGIYRVKNDEPELVVPNVSGTGICFLSDGSALVSRYGQQFTNFWGGRPGALVYVPAKFFQ